MQTDEKILLQINEQTINETTKCSRDFDCLKNENHFCSGNVVSCVAGKVHFVNCTGTCMYKVRFGNSPFCSCPTRKAIFNIYGK